MECTARGCEMYCRSDIAKFDGVLFPTSLANAGAEGHRSSEGATEPCMSWYCSLLFAGAGEVPGLVFVRPHSDSQGRKPVMSWRISLLATCQQCHWQGPVARVVSLHCGAEGNVPKLPSAKRTTCRSCRWQMCCQADGHDGMYIFT